MLRINPQDAVNNNRAIADFPATPSLASPEKIKEFEYPVKLDHVSFIDGHTQRIRIFIEKKGVDIDLRHGYKQPDGSVLTPYQQARRYMNYLPHDMHPCWIVVCSFREFRIHGMDPPPTMSRRLRPWLTRKKRITV